jgi:hypothetical protein
MFFAFLLTVNTFNTTDSNTNPGLGFYIGGGLLTFLLIILAA